MEPESCRNCANYPGCLIRGAAIFHFFILTGRDRELPGDGESFNARGLCNADNEFHHDKRTDGYNLVVILPRLNSFFKRNGNYALCAVRAVVGHYGESIRAGGKLVLKNY